MKGLTSDFNLQANEMLQAAKVSQNKLERRQHLMEALKVELSQYDTYPKLFTILVLKYQKVYFTTS